MISKQIKELNKKFKNTSAKETLEWFLKEYKGKIALASSLGVEDQVLTEMIISIDKSIPIFTLDTGRLFSETYSLIERIKVKYNISIKVYFPDSIEVEEMVNKKGVNLFYESIEKRKLCCKIRKLNPLKRAMKDLDV